MRLGDWDVVDCAEVMPVYKVGHEPFLVVGGVLDSNDRRRPETELTFIGKRPEILGFLLDYNTELFKIRLHPGTAVRVWEEGAQRVYYRPIGGMRFVGEEEF